MIEVFICCKAINTSTTKQNYLGLACEEALHLSSLARYLRVYFARYITPKWRACSHANLDLELL